MAAFDQRVAEVEPNLSAGARAEQARLRSFSGFLAASLRNCCEDLALLTLIVRTILFKLTFWGGLVAGFGYVFALVVERLHISWNIAVIFLPFFLLHLPVQVNPGYLVRLKLDHVNIPLYRFSQKAFLGLNLIGGLIPVAIALYQFAYSPELIRPAAIITAVVAIVTYSKVKVLPGEGVRIHLSSIVFICFLTAILSILLIPSTPERLDVSIAFSGGVLGCLIGADILHIKDLNIAQKGISMSMGGAGRWDGILLMGLLPLLMTEWLPGLFDAISVKWLIGGLVAVVVCYLLLLLVVFYMKWKCRVLDRRQVTQTTAHRKSNTFLQ